MDVIKTKWMWVSMTPEKILEHLYRRGHPETLHGIYKIIKGKIFRLQMVKVSHKRNVFPKLNKFEKNNIYRRNKLNKM